MTYSLTRRSVLIGGSALALTMMLASRPSQAATKIQRLVSPGGIEAWFVQDSTVPLIAMEYGFGGGASQDPAGKPGVGNLVADLLDEGSGDLDSRTFHERLDRRAVKLSFNATGDQFRGSLRMLKHNKDEAFDLLRMALTAPRFEVSDVERIRAQVLSNLRRASTDPSAIARRKFLEVAFGDHPYGRHAQGTLESVPTIEIAELKDYAGRVLAKDTLKVAVVGDVDPDTLGKLLDHTFAGLPAKATLTPVAGVAVAKPPQRAFIPLDVPQTVVTFGGPGIRRSEPDFMPAYVVNHILGGGGLSSRLYREVREKRGLAYSIYEALVWMEHSALFIGNTGTRADRASETVDAIDKEIRRMAEEGPNSKGARRGQILSEGVADARARHLLEARAGAAAVSDRQTADRLYREAQRHRRCGDAGRCQEGVAAALGAGSAHHHRRPPPAGRCPVDHRAIGSYAAIGSTAKRRAVSRKAGSTQLSFCS